MVAVPIVAPVLIGPEILPSVAPVLIVGAVLIDLQALDSAAVADCGGGAGGSVEPVVAGSSRLRTGKQVCVNLLLFP
ncbi:MAG: hypothetical protein NTY19_04325 [Planctomycetota bacterium]|nr:hypothetical protein [Planctomycetota bacterium]